MPSPVVIRFPARSLAIGALVANHAGARGLVRLQHVQATDGRYELVVVEKLSGVSPEAVAQFVADAQARYGQAPTILRHDPDGAYWIRLVVPQQELQVPLLRFAGRFFESMPVHALVEGETFALQLDCSSDDEARDVRERVRAFLRAGRGAAGDASVDEAGNDLRVAAQMSGA